MTQVARAVVYMAGLPLDANVLFMTVMATKMPFCRPGMNAVTGSISERCSKLSWRWFDMPFEYSARKRAPDCAG